MTATFVLAFAQGAASVIPTADVMSDGFGVIALVAMAPVLSLNLLGTFFKRKVEAAQREERAPAVEPATLPISEQVCLFVDVARGDGDEVVRVARESGAQGATILHGRGGEIDQAFRFPLLGVEVLPERELILLVLTGSVAVAVAEALRAHPELKARLHRAPAKALMKDYNTEE